MSDDEITDCIAVVIPPIAPFSPSHSFCLFTLRDAARAVNNIRQLFSSPQPDNDPGITGASQMDAFYETANDEGKDLTLPVIDIVWEDIKEMVAENAPLSSIVTLLTAS
ncbi:unnamed protein product [Vitrella brassicaformis CCMP3155]|uniref:Uncharacterized protein n=1 Tax=Vitrella brassicaformis (strain CCMP3155) TaxID=1169540 RepID=A0A0G4EMQ5_VITBC|nr:unnamed protein product [Vitrella brassicaformis CCMP3155]|eukprot:CEL98265.1 unnamed protein product [Vitrella brassicaformis CCMP3155]